MKTSNALAIFAAMADRHRFAVFQLLLKAGPGGMRAGKIAIVLDLAPNALSYHLTRLRAVGLIAVRRNARTRVYVARFEPLTALLRLFEDRRHYRAARKHSMARR
jgi:DNA-binding transcriptional ArsR family regulator